MQLRFWGVRGSVPTPGPGTVRYGGNTSCVEVRVGSEILILDAGTGLRMLGRHLTEEFQSQALSLTILLTHTHWDHIQGLPFFAPLYDPRYRVRILGCRGARRGLLHREAVAAGAGPRQMLVALGYSSWGEGQLESELGDNAWLTVPADPALLFEVPIEQRYERAMGLLGLQPWMLAPGAGRA